MEPTPPRIYVLPNLMTAGNLLCGFMAILWIFEGTLLAQQMGLEDKALAKYRHSLYFILGAFVFDFLDGRVARMGGLESPFGIQFDSLADLISFGLAPALLMVKIVLAEFHRFGWFLAFIYLACGALRLARFNCIAASADKSTSKDFMGFPIPAAAGLIASITLFLLWMHESDRVLGKSKYILPFVMLFLSFMMFSKIKYPSFKSIDWRTQYSIQKLLIVILILALVLMHYQVMLMVAFMAYLLYGFVRPLISRAIIKEIEEGDEEEPVK